MENAQSMRFRVPGLFRAFGRNLHFRRPRVFISYRRSDLPEVAALACRTVADRYGASVFLDVDTISVGDDFLKIIKKAIRASDLVIAVVGTKWTGLLCDGEPPRIQKENDFVRQELEEAIRLDKPLVVLHRGPTTPPKDEVPRTLRRTLRPKWTSVDEEQLGHIIDREIRRLRRPRSWIMFAAVVLLHAAVWTSALPLLMAIYEGDGLKRRMDAAALAVGTPKDGEPPQDIQKPEKRIVVTITEAGKVYMHDREWPLWLITDVARSWRNDCRSKCYARVYIRGERRADPAIVFGLVRQLSDDGIGFYFVVQAQK